MARRGPRGSSFHVVLLAGGSGTRFWPLSRARRPKQFLPLGGRRSLLEETWRRVRKLAPTSRLWVVAPAALATDVRRTLPQLERGHLITEPSPRDTAPAITLATLAVAGTDPDAVMGVFPTDHVIRKSDAFVRAVRVAQRAAARGALVCLGVRPDRPATGFGYLECAAVPVKGRAVPVSRFVEKPDLARARRFLRSGRFLWNGGMFVWRAERYLEEVAGAAPGILRAVRSFREGRKSAWGRAQKLSVDYAVMEKARGLRVVPLDAGWDDVGSWDAAARLREEAGIDEGKHILIDSPETVVFGDERIVAVVDVPGVTVVDTPDALLVVSRSEAEKVRRVVAELRRRRRNSLL